MNWIETERGAFRYELSGTKTGVPVVLMHEMGGCLESWDAVAPVLAADRPVLRYDIRGFGMSCKAPGSVSIQDWVDDLVELLRVLSVRVPVDVIGCALGAAGSLAFAARHPALCRSVLAFSPVTEVHDSRRTALRGIADSMEQVGLDPLVDAFFDASYLQELRKDAVAYAAFRARWMANDPHSFARTYRMLTDLNMDDDLAALNCPVHLVGASLDRLRPPKMVAAMQSRIKGSTYEEIKTGHFASAQTPAMVVDIAQRWFTGLADGGAGGN